MADANKPDLCSDTSEENVKFELAKIPEDFLTDDLILGYVNDTIINLKVVCAHKQILITFMLTGM